MPKWNERLAEEGRSPADLATEMRGVNPWLIARNHRIEEAIAAANYGDFSFFERLTTALEKPYEDQPEFADLMAPPPKESTHSSALHDGHIGRGGWRRTPHDAQRCTRRRCSLRPSQKNCVSGDIDGASRVLMPRPPRP